MDSLIGRRTLSSWQVRVKGLGHITEPSKEQEPVKGVLPVRLVRTWVQIRRQKGSLINFQSVRHPSNYLLG
jgi:hypothetical protein